MSASRSGGYRRSNSFASATFLGSTCATARVRSSPSNANAIEHQSANHGTAACATLVRVRS